MTTIELDSTLTADGRLIIYHDTKVNTELCRTTAGKHPQATLLSSLKGSELKQLDCGSVPHKRFPQQSLEPVSPFPAQGSVITRKDLALPTPL